MTSRELDALVAEKVMGWVRMTEGELYGGRFDTVYPAAESAGFDRTRLCSYWLDPQLTNEYGEPEATRPAEDSDWDDDVAWPPSTDIGAAWEVVEKLLGLGYTLELYSPGGLIEDEFDMHSIGWGVNFCTWSEPYLPAGRVGATLSHTMDEKPDGTVIETVMEAICLAALKTVEG